VHARAFSLIILAEVRSRILWALLVAVGAALLYFSGLTAVGLLSVDEPRYAAIGREMARSGDWTTPRLWGEVWLEKPALLYWMVAVGHLLGLPGELAPRLPVAVWSVGFLILFWWRIKEQFDSRAAWTATVILATSTGWLAYSHLAVTDIPLSACFAASMLLLMPWVLHGERRDLLVWSGVCFGLAILAKGLVPVALAAPLVVLAWRRLPGLFLWALIAVAVAAPWYFLFWMRNGQELLLSFLVRDHWERFLHGETLHRQPFWFYVPVLLAGMLPWTPLCVLLFRRVLWRDPARRFLLIWSLFGFALFSRSAGKLPGYLLPLLPALAALLGVEASRERGIRRIVLLSASVWLAMVLAPHVVQILPRALEQGIRSSEWSANWGAVIVATLVAVGFAVAGAPFRWVSLVIAATMLVSTRASAVRLESLVSARDLWRTEVAGREQGLCVESMHRSWRYGLNYYTGTPLPDCEDQNLPSRLVTPEDRMRPKVQVSEINEQPYPAP